MSTIIRFGLDLAKNSLSVCGVDAHEKVQVRKSLKRGECLAYFAQQSPAMVAMESGSGAHHWARQLQAQGHDVRIIDPRRVAPYRKQGHLGKNDSNDAAAICEAASRPQMRYVPIKSAAQQAVLMVHRLRSAAVAEHTRIINQMRGLLAEFGIVIAQGAACFKAQWHLIRQRHDDDLPASAWESLDQMHSELTQVHDKVLAYDRRIKQFVRDSARARRLSQVPGIGAITASAIVATVGNGRDFRNGRQFAAWLGLVPRQYSTGGKPKLGRITKRGDTYLRTLLVHAARSELTRTAKRKAQKSRWAEQLKSGKSWNKAAVALANKHARIAWSLLANDYTYQPA